MRKSSDERVTIQMFHGIYVKIGHKLANFWLKLKLGRTNTHTEFTNYPYMTSLYQLIIYIQ